MKVLIGFPFIASSRINAALLNNRAELETAANAVTERPAPSLKSIDDQPQASARAGGLRARLREKGPPDRAGLRFVRAAP
ncbi:hypothetical protein [Bradyrhizobium iriomotense]|uniref:hypothetical protein n=1 Tax=Bradyrhizobium iriomotense TaxID=441950 RepID=UPI001B89F672|nr:hypothetical protein [Bradyrhizobium iriomotense]MBR0783585.1 hypothetical protein [Bradyrhizobium iriomotense]